MSNSEDISDSEQPSCKKSKMNNKTPISILTELCSQKVNYPASHKLIKSNNLKYNFQKTKPIFQELDPKTLGKNVENSVIKFYIKVSALSKTALGFGVTKKAAKHAAAEQLLKKINNAYDSDDEDESFNAYNTDYVSELLNLCVQKNFHKPDFVLTESYGPTHLPVFTIECRLDSIKRSGSASNKQLAKKLAAKQVLDILKLSYPDQEKKLMHVNDENMAKEEARRKITSYLELKNRNQTNKMGTLLCDRHLFFIDHKDEEFIESLKTILLTNMNLSSKYQALQEELQNEWECKISRFADTDLKMFELLIEFDQFTVNLVAKEDDLERTVIDYFMDMLQLKPINDEQPTTTFFNHELVLTPL